MRIPLTLLAASIAVLLGATAGGQTTKYPVLAPSGHRPGFARAVGRAVASPSGAKIFGYDVSADQGNINWSVFSGATSFAVVKASYGCPNPGESASQYADSKFAQNRAGAEQNGVEVGFYHFAYPVYNPNITGTYSSAVAEANCFCDNVGSLQPGEFVALDMEENGYTGDYVAWSKTWLDQVQSRLGVKPLLYIELSWAQKYNWSPVINAGYGLWMARWDYDKNAGAPATGWAVCAMRQYSDKESGIPGDPGNSQGYTDGDVFYGSLDQLKKYGYQNPGTPSSVSWTIAPQASRWYRSDEHLVYHVNGDLPNTVQQLIDGAVTATFSTSDGYIALSYGTTGWHHYSVSAFNASNTGPPSNTGDWVGGYDTDPPIVANTGGASPTRWYSSSSTTVTFKCADALSGVRRFRYQWDSTGTFSDWQNTDTGTVTLQQGKHHLFVEAEDNTYTGSAQSGNQATIDLGEYWLNTALTGIQISETMTSTSSQVQIVLTIQNPGASSVDSVGFDLVQLGSSKAVEGAWSVGSIVSGSTVTKTFTFNETFGTNKGLLFSANYHIGTNKIRYRVRLQHP